MKFKQTSYGNNNEILKFGAQDYVAQPIMVSATGITADSDGKKIVKAGSILSSAGAIVNDATAEGVLLYDVDVTYGDAAGALVVFGFIDGTKIPVREINQTALSAMKLIKFYDIFADEGPVITLTAGAIDTSTHKVKVAVKVEDNSAISTCKYLYDTAAKTASDFASAGTAITLVNGEAEVEVLADDSTDKYLTVYALDAVGNDTVKDVEIEQY